MPNILYSISTLICLKTCQSANMVWFRDNSYWRNRPRWAEVSQLTFFIFFALLVYFQFCFFFTHDFYSYKFLFSNVCTHLIYHILVFWKIFFAYDKQKKNKKMIGGNLSFKVQWIYMFSSLILVFINKDRSIS